MSKKDYRQKKRNSMVGLYVCERCGTLHPWTAIHVHHKDGNHNNHRLANLQALCVPCHRRTHNEMRQATCPEKWPPGRLWAATLEALASGEATSVAAAVRSQQTKPSRETRRSCQVTNSEEQ